jgi:hypothetical protein
MSILKREVLYSVKGGQVKFLDWAITKTKLGACAEPFNFNARDGITDGSWVDYDPSDMMVKVDRLHLVADETEAKTHLSGGGMHVNGGNLLPRVLIFTGDN